MEPFENRRASGTDSPNVRPSPDERPEVRLRRATAARPLRPATRRSPGIIPDGRALGGTALAEAFAWRILARYGSSYAGLASVEAILRLRPDGPEANLFQMIANVSMRAHLVMRVAEPSAPARIETRVPAPADAAPDASRPIVVSHARTTHVRSVASNTPVPAGTFAVPKGATATTRTVFERIFARERRIDLTDHQVARTPPSVTALSSQQIMDDSKHHRLELIMPRRAAAPSPQLPGPPPGAMAVHSAASGHVARATAAAPTGGSTIGPLSAGDVGRLTEAVVRVIDRRIAAERERKGLV